MTQSSSSLILAADGGGTRCRLAVRCGEGATHKIEVGATNVSTDFEAACIELRHGLEALSVQSGYSLAEFEQAPSYLGLAGITGDAIAKKLAAALPFRNVKIEDDRPASLRGALGAKDGFVAHCGTGSFVAMQKGESMRFVGGWGSVLGDQASAQWVGKRSLSRALEYVDGVTGPSQLARSLLSRYGGAAGVVRAASEMTPSEFGALAPLVTELSDQNDEPAISILQDGADYLVEMMKRMGWGEGTPICLTGGIGPCYAPYLPLDMQSVLSQPAGDPLSGALALARAYQKEIEHECS
ncbi:BadF/BadG/BcrA/BcrD ATPase family protein [Ruegeria sp. 6PALISEP08]|uniref:BadF/BadG/BcrA/BcrD ATPase family protein n=1 Tax=Ruegeria sp. 6PALISEP08 TaxID=1225660 RepID=UPI00067F1EFE|nr:BadF/BadG/BcrA/BcrD ATPase family protein [Ruegeria sp. 6PALISEP08]